MPCSFCPGYNIANSHRTADQATMDEVNLACLVANVWNLIKIRMFDVETCSVDKKRNEIRILCKCSMSRYCIRAGCQAPTITRIHWSSDKSEVIKVHNAYNC